MTTLQTASSFMTVKEVAGHFNAGVSTIWRWVKNGDLPPPVKIGGSTRWRRADIEAAFTRAA
ncbi:helix-turn-helix transcriptional regulator [Fuscibacter oryzae]|uniref:Helix-turn-helix domain-containing protein n=1 Tax=Fuscibacter oryzae TaxID=2803939 RepID=A0A8J7MST7_9RHOB|nr:helix-turn-helix domain-containing protein [Fuscibacter oryzae]MBL4928916.1 helix-turn-helix domain-containing protein [Fuscibacter oryzae]